MDVEGSFALVNLWKFVHCTGPNEYLTFKGFLAKGLKIGYDASNRGAHSIFLNFRWMNSLIQVQENLYRHTDQLTPYFREFFL